MVFFTSVANKILCVVHACGKIAIVVRRCSFSFFFLIFVFSFVFVIIFLGGVGVAFFGG